MLKSNEHIREVRVAPTKSGPIADAVFYFSNESDSSNSASLSDSKTESKSKLAIPANRLSRLKEASGMAKMESYFDLSERLDFIIHGAVGTNNRNHDDLDSKKASTGYDITSSFAALIDVCKSQEFKIMLSQRLPATASMEQYFSQVVFTRMFQLALEFNSLYVQKDYLQIGLDSIQISAYFALSLVCNIFLGTLPNQCELLGIHYSDLPSSKLAAMDFTSYFHDNYKTSKAKMKSLLFYIQASELLLMCAKSSSSNPYQRHHQHLRNIVARKQAVEPIDSIDLQCSKKTLKKVRCYKHPDIFTSHLHNEVSYHHFEITRHNLYYTV
jgi:hypothetical protein